MAPYDQNGIFLLFASMTSGFSPSFHLLSSKAYKQLGFLFLVNDCCLLKSEHSDSIIILRLGLFLGIGFSTGKWWHAGFHLTTAIVGPTILTLPYAFRGMGWAVGITSLTATAMVTFYSYYLMSKVLDHCEKEGRRHIRFRELAADVLGKMAFPFFIFLVILCFFTGYANDVIVTNHIVIWIECLPIALVSVTGMLSRVELTSPCPETSKTIILKYQTQSTEIFDWERPSRMSQPSDTCMRMKHPDEGFDQVL